MFLIKNTSVNFVGCTMILNGQDIPGDGTRQGTCKENEYCLENGVCKGKSLLVRLMSLMYTL